MTELRFLADESCDFAVVRALRQAGYDVLTVGDATTRSDDLQLIKQAAIEGRILLTKIKISVVSCMLATKTRLE